ncbi:hypothetical protein ACFLQK_00450 [bacterium]
MLAEIDRRRLTFMVNVSSISPVIYGLIAYLVQNHAFQPSASLRILSTIFLFVSFGLLLASRLVEGRLVPHGATTEDLPPGRAALACMLLAGMAEGIAFLGLVMVILGTGFKAFGPYFLLCALAVADFRLTRFHRILELAPEHPPDDPPH